MLRLAAILCLLALLAAPTGADAAPAETRLLRFPDLHGDRVVFTYAGDLWLAPADGGAADRLTAHPGVELFAKFSPDGRRIAFTGQYDGDEQVYVIPAEGGIPTQLTFYPANGPLAPRWGYDNQVYGWTPDGSAVLFRSMRDGWDLSDTRLYTVSVDGGLPAALPIPQSGAGDFSPDGRRVVYSPLVRDFRHWKRYEGGWAQDLYLFDLESHAAERITDHPRSDRDPMWIDDRIYFASDRDGKLNLYVWDPATGATEQLTAESSADVRWPSADAAGRRIVYELDGALEIFDIDSGSARKLTIRVPDDGLARRPSRLKVSGTIAGFGLSPRGERAVFAARGDIFSAPIEHGPTRNLTRSSGAHDREPAWSPDGSRIAFVSDRDGEEEIWTVDQAGRAEAEQLTDGNSGRSYQPDWSPDGERIAFRDQRGKLFVVEVATGEQIEVGDDAAPFGLDYDWSPDGRWLAFSLASSNGLRSLYIWGVDDGQTRRITDDLFNEYSPAWDPDGDYLFYLSDREFAPQIGSFEFDYAIDRETYVYALALTADLPNPFPPQSDEVEPGARADAGAGEDDEETGDGEEGEIEPVEIDFDRLAHRVARVPIEADNYSGLAAIEGHLVYLRGTPFYYGREADVQPEVRVFARDDREEAVVVAGVQGMALSADGSKLMVSLPEGLYQLLETTAGAEQEPKPISTEGLAVDRVPAEEWEQIFDEVWRRYRDFFYVENMHGLDWEALGERYRPLLAHVAHRSDLNYVISEMISELSVSHTYIAGGDYQMPERPQAALLGARFELDPEGGRYRIAKIFPGDNAEDTYRSPLTEVGVDVSEGDYVLAINRRQLTAEENPFRLLRHAGGAPVELMVNERPTIEGARHVVVSPISDEDPLLYLDWIEGNRRWVEERSAGRVGYIHLPDMGAGGIREWIKWYYGQVGKEGLIIDVRSNGGGNVSQMIINRLARELLMVDFERNTDYTETYPQVTFSGHLVCLLDEDTASDGDQFAWAFRRAGLGPLIGKRSWGGVVGYYPGRAPLIDGGSVSVPEAGTADPEGRWVIEGYGVDPDIVVENDPREILAGRDQQLEKALEVVLARIEEEPRRLPDRPEPPDKSP